jgi:hypothetical protein
MEMMTLNEWLTHNNLSETVDNIDKYEHYILSTICSYRKSMKPSTVKIELEMFSIIKNTINVKQTLQYKNLSDQEIEDKLFNDLIKLHENLMRFNDYEIDVADYSFYKIKKPVVYINGILVSQLKQLSYITNAFLRHQQYISNKQHNHNFPTDRAIIDQHEWGTYLNQLINPN